MFIGFSKNNVFFFLIVFKIKTHFDYKQIKFKTIKKLVKTNGILIENKFWYIRFDNWFYTRMIQRYFSKRDIKPFGKMFFFLEFLTSAMQILVFPIESYDFHLFYF